eukprot:TRINITY_DN3791_c0_g1_i1.p2 TRINITY_DN3791_c0_g1~~TRINITY_DN3791_c0_g1_i1.p2  ORF type:complete len:63 (+),score=4.49 TRINITY_DN3791_c0_g1_i1:283-471(+)
MQLCQPQVSLLFVLNRVKLVLVKSIYILDVSQPFVDQAMAFVLKCGFDASAICVAHDNGHAS